jgi:hypothetical protein
MDSFKRIAQDEAQAILKAETERKQKSLTTEDLLYIEARRQSAIRWKQKENELQQANEKHRKMMENTDDEYFVPESNNESYYLSNFA